MFILDKYLQTILPIYNPYQYMYWLYMAYIRFIYELYTNYIRIKYVFAT